ncbi:phosphate ABC transporter, inner membrane subunit PstC [Anaeromyxobacter sp. K]|uniref:phosphate ABC transporter permease subunit PstC n=1 Tax=Anaeromyxobacter sp. (strain K) TaxID=447217 RepID=UPI00015F8D24|nr:phosphate ABC transporter permease subunit PstC [Anaeromyxobacter sp. K]ACG75324.1 phosphate ABC transporter, inner membrane subunit PstC [Anaeromyxobacter sp. K]
MAESASVPAIAPLRRGEDRPLPSIRRRQLREAAIRGIITLIALTGIAAVVLIFVFVAREALPLLTDPEVRGEASFGKMFLPQVLRPNRPPGYMWQPVSGVPKYSMIPLFVGTLKVTAVSMLVSVPVGIAAALYASEFAPRRLREVLKPVIELLAGIPSVVLGFFALMVMATWLQSAFGFTFRLNAVVAGLGLALTVIPVIFTVSEDALQAVPRAYREASLALGATRWETAFRVILPAAAPGVLAGVVLGFGRSIGETMIVLMASGNAAITSWSLGDSVRTLPATIAAEMGEVVFGGAHYSVLFFIGVELFLFTFVLNALAAAFVKRLVRRMSGGAA